MKKVSLLNDLLNIQKAICFFILLMYLGHASNDSKYLKLLDITAKDQFWLDLLHYKKNISSGYISNVKAVGFFFAPNGMNNPLSELNASIKAFYSKNVFEKNKHPICKFPARLSWLIQKGLIEPSRLPIVACPSLKAWQENKGAFKSISLVFATGFLKNPISYFGHLFLKLNSYNVNSENNLRNPIINFGADVTENDNPLLYAFKGLTGGYASFYSQNDFYAQQFNYGSNQLRDIWEYELNFDINDVNFIALRLWELLTQKFDYYYINENCAYFIIDILEKQLQKKILPKLLPYSLPKTAITKLTNMEYKKGIPLIRQKIYHPSKQSIFYQKYKLLSGDEKKTFISLIEVDIQNNPIDFNNPNYLKLLTKSKQKLVDILLDYHDYLHAGSIQDLNTKKIRQKILAQSFDLPIVKKGSYSFPKILTKSPDQGSSSGLFSTGATYDEKNEELYGLVRFRPTSHDYLMPSIGRPPNSQLAVFDLEIQFYKTNFKVSFFDLINIQTLNNSETGLPGDGGIAWAIRMGYGPDQLACFSCDSYFTRGSLGYSFGNNSNTILPYTMIGGQIQSRSRYGSYIHSHLYAGILINSNEYFAMRGEFGYKYYLEKGQKYNSFASTEMKITTASFYDVRFLLEYEMKTKAIMYFNIFW